MIAAPFVGLFIFSLIDEGFLFTFQVIGFSALIILPIVFGGLILRSMDIMD